MQQLDTKASEAKAETEETNAVAVQNKESAQEDQKSQKVHTANDPPTSIASLQEERTKIKEELKTIDELSPDKLL